MFSFSGLIDDFKVRLDLTLKAVIAGAIAAFAGMAAFVCALVVLFVWMLDAYGPLEAWAVMAAVFAGIAVLAFIPLAAAGKKRKALAQAAAARAAKAEREKKQKEWWQDPALALAGLQVAQTMGIRRMLPILAIGAIAAGYLWSRQGSTPTETPVVQPAE